MALTFEDQPVRLLTVEEAERICELGVLEDMHRLELLHGVLVEKPVKGEPHELVKQRLARWLAPGFAADRFRVRTEGAFRVPDRMSLPEPDVAVLAPSDATGHPSSGLLLIEVSDTSLNIDSTAKVLMYAAAGVPEYWVVDVNARRVHVFTEPQPKHFGFRRTAYPPERIQPSGFDIEPLDLDVLFAGLQPG